VLCECRGTYLFGKTFWSTVSSLTLLYAITKCHKVLRQFLLKQSRRVMLYNIKV
jgi:hypothetical protein